MVVNILLLSPDRVNSRIKTYLEEVCSSVTINTSPITLEYLKEINIDYLISYGYAPIIKEPIITAYRHKIINLHNSFLPYGKGIYPIVWSILQNYPTGATLHFIDEGIDSGEIIFQKEVTISNHNTLKESWDILRENLEDLFVEKWPYITSGKYQLVKQKDLNISVKYRSRKDSDKLMSLFPKSWDTTVGEVRELGKIFCNYDSEEEFWGKHYHD